MKKQERKKQREEVREREREKGRERGGCDLKMHWVVASEGVIERVELQNKAVQTNFSFDFWCETFFHLSFF
jgi:hypothetical protein